MNNVRENAVKQFAKKLACYCRCLPLDAISKLRHGADAPVKYQMIYVQPDSIQWAIRGLSQAKKRSCQLYFDGDWDEAKKSINELPEVLSTKRKLNSGMSWEDVGEVDRELRKRSKGRKRRYATKKDLDQRYSSLDRLTKEARERGIIRSSQRVFPLSFRESEGIKVAIGRDGEILKYGEGKHRLAIAQALALESVPVAVVAVHPQAMHNGSWKRILHKSRQLQTSCNRTGPS